MSTAQETLETERFLHRAVQYIKTTFPEQTASIESDTLKDKVISATQFALQYGFKTEADAMILVDLLWRLPPDFLEQEEYEWVTDILKNDDMDNEFKIETLHNAFVMMQAILAEETEKE